jgi:hypothetical protein
MFWVWDVDGFGPSITFDKGLSSGGVGGKGSFGFDVVFAGDAELRASSVETLPEDWAWAFILLLLEATSDVSFGGVGRPFSIRTALKFGACSATTKLLAGLCVVGAEYLRGLGGVVNGSILVKLSEMIGVISWMCWEGNWTVLWFLWVGKGSWSDSLVCAGGLVSGVDVGLLD